MKQFLLFVCMVAALTMTGCPETPTSPDDKPSATSTPTHVPGGGIVATATPNSTAATPTPGTGSTTTYSVMYEVISTNCSLNATYLDSNTTSNTVVISSSPWSQTVTLSAEYKAEIVAAYAGITAVPSMVLNIYVDGSLMATQSLSGFGSAITCSYWLP